MTVVQQASSANLDDLVRLEGRLFEEDAGEHDSYVDLTWSDREGRGDFVRLLGDPCSLVLIAQNEGRVVGHLVGYSSAPSPTRQPVTFAILRSMYVEAAERRQGVGHQLVRHFREWAVGQGCVEAHVASYVANKPAQDFYEQLGFSGRSLSRVLSL